MEIFHLLHCWKTMAFGELKNESEHWLRFEKSSWFLRTENISAKEYLKDIIQLSYSLLIKKIAGQSIVIDNEASFQLQFSQILQTLGKLYEFQTNDLFLIELESNIELKQESKKSGTNKARIDVVLSLGDEQRFATCAIELKFFKKQNQREPNNRYDVFKDLSNLEQYKNKFMDLSYFILGTDHSHYVLQEKYSDATGAFDFRDGKSYKSGTKLIYNTEKPYGEPILLQNDYAFTWDRIHKSYGFSEELFFLKVEI